MTCIGCAFVSIFFIGKCIRFYDSATTFLTKEDEKDMSMERLDALNMSGLKNQGETKDWNDWKLIETDDWNDWKLINHRAESPLQPNSKLIFCV